MLGHEAETLEALEERPEAPVDARGDDAGDPRPRARAATARSRRSTSTIHPGEVVGLAGLLGSGRTEVARLLFGADHADQGQVASTATAAGQEPARRRWREGIAFCPENRKTEGLVAELTIRENIILAMQAARGWTKPIPRKRQDELVEKWIKALDIRPAKPEQIVGTLSGGNQQKVLLARWLITEPKLLILDEPTRGIDVGAKAQIQKLVAQLVRRRHVGAVRLRRARGGPAAQPQGRRSCATASVVAELPNDDSLTMDRLVDTIASGAERMTTAPSVLAAARAASSLLVSQRRSSRQSFFSLHDARTGTSTAA